MRMILASLVGVGLLVSPAQAGDWRDRETGVRPAVFVGAKLRLSMGRKHAVKPSAALAIAPAQSRISGDGMINTRIGEGIALNFTSGVTPTLTLAGARADTVLGLQRSGERDSDEHLGISTGGWIAIGVGSVALIFGGLYLAADHIADCDEGECD